MQTKLFEVRDRGTFLCVIATVIDAPANVAEHYLMRRSGYGEVRCVMLTHLQGRSPAHVEPHEWGMNGSMKTAHEYIEQNWDTLVSGEVICTEYIRGERPTKKVSERLE